MCQCVGGLEPYFIYINQLFNTISEELYAKCDVATLRADWWKQITMKGSKNTSIWLQYFLTKPDRHPHSHPSFSRTHYYFKHFLRYWMNELLVRVFRPENSFSFYYLSLKFCSFFKIFCWIIRERLHIPPHSQLQIGTTKHSSLLHLHFVNTKQSR